MPQNVYRKGKSESQFLRRFLTRTHLGPQGLPMQVPSGSQGQFSKPLAWIRHSLSCVFKIVVRFFCDKRNRQYFVAWFWVWFSWDGAKRGSGAGRSPLDTNHTSLMILNNTDWLFTVNPFFTEGQVVWVEKILPRSISMICSWSSLRCLICYVLCIC